MIHIKIARRIDIIMAQWVLFNYCFLSISIQFILLVSLEGIIFTKASQFIKCVISCNTMEKKCYRNCDHFYFMFSTNKCLCCMSAWENTSHKHAHMSSRMNLSFALILWLRNESLLIGVRASKRISSVFAACILHVYFLEATMPLWSARMPMSLRYDDCSPKARLYGAYKLHAAVNLSQRKTSATSVTT